MRRISSSAIASKIKDSIFGENHVRIDIALDYFFSLRQEKRAKIISYTVISFVLSCLLIIIIYFWKLHNLQVELNNATSHVKDLNMIKPTYISVNQEFKKITENLQMSNQYSYIVAAINNKTKDLSIEFTPLPDQPTIVDLENSDSLYNDFQKVRIDYSLKNVSLKKIIEYVNTIQQMPNRFRVSKLEIQQKFGTKLYFDVNLSLQAYIPIARNGP